MKPLIPGILLSALTLALTAACAHPVRPALTNASVQHAPTTEPAAHKDFLTRTADATWDVVSAPVKLLTPPKKPAPAPPPTYEAPEAIIVVPEAAGGEGLLGVATQPATTLPK